MQHKIVVLNSELVDYDNQIDFHALGGQVTIYRARQPYRPVPCFREMYL